MPSELGALAAVVAIVLAIYALALRERVGRAEAMAATAQTEINELQARFTERVQQEVRQWREREVQDEAATRASVLLQQWQMEKEKEIRADAVRRSGSTIAGKVSEHLAPWLPGFPFNPKDVRFLGAPIDLVVFDGLNDGSPKRIVFVEIKAGSSTLNARERAIRNVVENRAVEWLEHRLEIASTAVEESLHGTLSASLGSSAARIVPCPACGRQLRIPTTSGRVRCPDCQEVFRL
ncbi:MAG: hypothetical protein IT177_11115 [Acidobacteria bacterium]|nr:hypothetical protein [Acidobacteriota bacterium]